MTKVLEGLGSYPHNFQWHSLQLHFKLNYHKKNAMYGRLNGIFHYCNPY